MVNLISLSECAEGAPYVPQIQATDPAEIFKLALGSVSAGRLLDIATGEGDFIRLLTSFLKEYESITGIDNDGIALAAAGSAFEQENIRFVQMDAACLGFAADSFDSVNVSASLHHLLNIRGVLVEMKRVLKPGGKLILSEMHRDGKTEAQALAVSLHHWKAEVDSEIGIPHHKTFPRQELMHLIKALELQDIQCYEFMDMGSDPMDEESVQEIETFIERILERAVAASNSQELAQRGEALRKQLHAVGVQREPVMIIVGRKETA